jgi:hypothetical protein
MWRSAMVDPDSGVFVNVEALIDNGAHTVLIDAKLAECMKLRRRKLPELMNISLTVSNSEKHVVTTLDEWVKLKLFDRQNLLVFPYVQL